MRRYVTGFFLLPLLLLSLSGCHAIGDKNASLSVIYCITASLSLLLLAGYCFVAKKKDPWFLLLFTSVLVVNIGYLALAISRNLDEALLANRLAYLGSVFLPLSMLMIILNVTNIRYRKWLPGLLIGLSIVVFFIAASPGYLDIYYKEVTFQKINGVTVLDKTYGPLHGLYLIYLVGYFAAMVSTIIYSTLQDKVDSVSYAAILAVAVFVNIGVWLIEQLVRIDFEILSVSYIISESFLLGLHLFIEETKKQKAVPIPQAGTAGDPPATPQPANMPESIPVDPAQIAVFRSGLAQLTPTERIIYECYIDGKTTKQIMEQLNIKENTLKFHNKNLYSKTGVCSRKQLVELQKHTCQDWQKP